jgi:Xaa-Pro aminopeptidase
MLVDSRFTLQSQKECPTFVTREFKGDLMKVVGEIATELGLTSLGFEPDHVTYSTKLKLRRAVPKPIRVVGARNTIEELRMVKDKGEIDTIKRAVDVADGCFSHLVEWIKPGMTEREVALEIDNHIRKHGAEKIAFDSIVAAGPNASFPHHHPTDAVLKKGQLVKLDFGATVDGYNSDITRMVFLGEPDAKQKEVYNIVLEAQLAAIKAIRPGLAGKDIDAVARDYIKEKGYGDFFGHGLGHSLGLATHDGSGLSSANKTKLKAGMVLTVEPGIYLADWGGVRIEDDIVVTESGCEVLTKSTKDIVVIK